MERAKEGEIIKIEDSYAYNGEGLRVAQTVSGATSYLTWDPTGGLPLILNDGTNNYVYGPGDMPIEQTNTEGKVQYLHHDQAGSTRLLTGSTGTVEGSYTYDAYGNQTGHTGTVTRSLGYDGEFTNSDTGLIYLRAREYDPTTAQFLSRDPLEALTGEPYSYANDDPINEADPTGRCGLVCLGGIVLGGVAVASGVGEVVVGGGAVIEGTLGAISVISGTGATVIDTRECVDGSGISCVGAAAGAAATGGASLGVIGSLGGGAAIGDNAAAGATAIGLTSGGIGFLGDVAGALASGCG